MNPSSSTMAPEGPGVSRLSTFLASKDRVARLALLVSAGAMLVAALYLALAIRISSRPIQFVVLNPDGDIIPVVGKPLPEARELHVRMAMLATTALLARNPKDFDQPEVLQGMFSKAALLTANQ